MEVLSYVSVCAIGALAGIAELASRYRDEPAKAIISIPGFIYIFVNMSAAAAALYMIDVFGWQFAVGESSSPQGLRIIQVLIAGFGAIALFRSALFTVRIGDNDVNVGPSAFLQILLNASDRAVDRNRAKSRAEQVARIMEGVTFEQAKTALPVLCFGLMQNLDSEQQRVAGNEIRSLIADTTISESVKLISLGLTLMTLVGESVLEAAVEALKKLPS